MPIGGETIGTAFVRVLASGDDLGDSIDDAFADNEDVFEARGRRNSQQYARAWEKEWKGPSGQRMRDALSTAIARQDIANDFFRSRKWNDFERQTRTRWGKIGALASRSLRDEFLRSGNLDGITEGMENIVSRISGLLDDLGDDSGRSLGSFDDRVRVVNGSLAELEDAASGAREAVDDLGDGVDEQSDVIHRRRSIFTTFGRDMDRMSDGISRAFGRGSRSELLNFFGVLVRNILRGIALLPRMIGFMSDLTREFRTARKAGNDFATSITSAFSGTAAEAGGLQVALGELAATGPAGLLALAGAAVAVVIALGPIASLITGIAGAITALAGSLTFAIAGALAPLLGLILPIAGAVAGIVLIVINLSNRVKELKAAVQPLTKAFTGLGDAVGDIALDALRDNADKLASSLSGLQPLLIGIADALGDAIGIFAQSFDTPAFRQFIRIMTRFIPDAIRSLTRSFTNVSAGLAGVFIALIPITKEFLGWLEDITGEFGKWANTRQGRQELREFFRDAGDSVKVWGDLLGNVVELIGILFTSGKGTGDSIVQSLSDNIDHFNKFLRENPDALADFFSHAEDIARDLGTIAQLAGRLIGVLDSPEARFALGGLFQIFIGILQGAIVVLGGIQRGAVAVVGFLGQLGGQIATLAQNVGSFLGSVFGAIPGLVAGLGVAIASGLAAAGRAMVSFGGFILQRIAHPFETARGIISFFFQTFARNVRLFGQGVAAIIQFVGQVRSGIISGISAAAAAVGRFIRSMVDRFVSGWQGLARQIPSLARQIVSGVGTALANLPGVVSRILGVARDIAGRIWSAIVSNAREQAQDFVGIFRDIPGHLRDLIGAFASAGRDIANAFIDALQGALDAFTPRLPHLPGPAGFVQDRVGDIFSASGGVFNGPQQRIIGEAGPEAVVPLNRPLSQVDPAVRALSAFAQGLTVAGSSTAGNGGTGKIINNDFTIVTPADDPEAVAHQVVNQLIATAF